MRSVLAVASAVAALPARAGFDTVFYGVIDASLVSARGAPLDGFTDAEPWNPAGPSALTLWDVSRSYLGFRADQNLGFGRRIELKLEQTIQFRHSNTEAAGIHTVEGWPFDKAALLQISHYAYGRLQLGRRSNIAQDFALDSQAWGGETLAGDPFSALLTNRGPRTARHAAVTYESPTWHDLTLGAQFTEPFHSHDHSATLSYGSGGLGASVALMKTSKDDRLVSMSGTAPLGAWRLMASTSSGCMQGQSGRYRSLSLARPWRAGEWRLGVTKYHVQMGPEVEKRSVGFHQALATQWVAYVDAVEVRPAAGGHRRSAADVGIRYSF